MCVPVRRPSRSHVTGKAVASEVNSRSLAALPTFGDLILYLRPYLTKISISFRQQRISFLISPAFTLTTTAFLFRILQLFCFHVSSFAFAGSSFSLGEFIVSFFFEFQFSFRYFQLSCWWFQVIFVDNSSFSFDDSSF